MKKAFIVLVVGIIIVVIGFVLLFTQKKSVTEAANLRATNITKIIFSDGRGGLNKPLTIENKQMIDQFMGYLDKCKVRKTVRDPKIGWIHSAAFYNKEKKLANVTFTDPMKINDQYYDILENNLSTSKIDDFLKSVNSSWKSTS